MVRRAARSLGWGVCTEEEEPTPLSSGDGGPSYLGKRRGGRRWNVWWTDTSVSTERCMRLQSFQVRAPAPRLPACLPAVAAAALPNTR